MAINAGLPHSQFLNVITLFSTFGQHESTSQYDAHGIKITNKKSSHYNTRAEGRWQIMPVNIQNWSIEYFGTVLDFSPENQEKIAFSKFAEYFAAHHKAGLSFESIQREMAGDWYGRLKPMP